ncbi:hypothetical protein ES708_30973 [subsurface metagenome]
MVTGSLLEEQVSEVTTLLNSVVLVKVPDIYPCWVLVPEASFHSCSDASLDSHK